MATQPLVISSDALSYYNVQNLHIACEGPKSIPISLDFSLGTVFTLLLQNFQSVRQFSGVQGVFIDNSQSSSPFSMTTNTGQVITIGPNRQGFFSVIEANPASFSFASTGSVPVFVALLNFPVTPHDWISI